MLIPDFVRTFMAVRAGVEIDIHSHAAVRMSERPEATSDRVEMAVRRGKIILDKCSLCPGKSYSKIVTTHFDGKSAVSVEVVVLHHGDFDTAEVRTVWVTKGRPRKARR